MKKTVRVGTRKSRLALVQTDMVKKKLEQAFPGVRIEIVKIDTKGDQILDRSLTSFGGKGVFTAELEAELLSGAIDIAVHSAKDMPMEFPEGLGIGAVLERGDVRDTFVTVNGKKLKDLPPGSVVGTSSLRRELLVKERNSHVQVKMLRGNVQTRLRKLQEGQYDGIILAAAGIERLGLEQEEGFFYEYLDPEVFLPAAGQGILAVESRTGDAEMAKMLCEIHCEESARMLQAERMYLMTLGGSCNAPAAALCREEEGILTMHAMYAKDGRQEKRTIQSRKLEERHPMQTAEELGKAAAKAVSQGRVSLVGAGPGDEELFTRKGMRLLRDADVVVYDHLVPRALLNEVRDDAELIYAGKCSSCHHLKQYETNQLLIALAREGKNVVRLKGGDPFIFGRGGEEGEELAKAGIDYEVVPGISSSYSVPAYSGIPVTHREYASSFHVITGHEGNHKNGKTVLDYATLAREEGTLIFLMGLNNLSNIANALITNGKKPTTPVAVIQEGTTARQRMVTGTLENIVEVVNREQIGTPAITVVGDVVGLAGILDWYGHQPLSGKRVLVTGSHSLAQRLSSFLREEGAEAISFSLVRTEPLHDPAFVTAMEELERYRWIVLTSANGVNYFFEEMRRMRKDIRDLSRVRFAVIGAGTRRALEEHGIYSDFMPDSYSSEDMATSLVPLLREEDCVLLLRAEEASPVLPDALRAAGIEYTCVALYRTVADMRKAEELSHLVQTVDYITFASSSAVRAFDAMVENKEKIKGKNISIGPVTTKTAEELGIPIHRTAVSYTARGMVECILQDAANREERK